MIASSPTPDHLNIQNQVFQHTPLHLAVVMNTSPIVRMLVVCGASLTARDRHGDTPLHLACARGYLECAREITAPPNEQELVQLLQNRCMIGLPALVNRCYQPQDMNIMNYDGEYLFACSQPKWCTPKIARGEGGRCDPGLILGLKCPVVSAVHEGVAAIGWSYLRLRIALFTDQWTKIIS